LNAVPTKDCANDLFRVSGFANLAVLLLGITMGRGAEGDVYPGDLAYLGPYTGDRRPDLTAPVTPAETAPPEWFGQSPWQDWSRLTGNWAGARATIETQGVTFGGNYLADASTVLSGGFRRASVFRGLLNINVTVDPKPVLGIEGGTFFAQYLFHHGPNGSADTGDLQGYSSIDAVSFSRAGEIWYEQKCLKDHLRMKIGQVDANSEFAFVSAAKDFINSSAGFSPTIANFPTYPNPDLSINVFAYPTDWFYAGAGVYAGSLREFSSTDLRHPYCLGEIGFTQKGNGHFGPGRIAAGFWHDTQTLARFDGGRENGTSGAYAVAEQQIWRKQPDKADDTKGVSLFVQYGYADAQVSDFNHHFGFGASAAGMVPRRAQDEAGLFCSLARLSRANGSDFDHDEIAVEGFYRFQVTGFWSLQPDLQWFDHPGGHSFPSHACVATLRLAADF
jgi:carbohydrate-selective porin OprB